MGWLTTIIAALNRTIIVTSKCTAGDGEGLVDFTDEEWSAMYGVPMSEYRFTGMEPETMKRCPECDGKGVLDLEDCGPHSWKDGV
jgi:DnaJ-class molecular chaperone